MNKRDEITAGLVREMYDYDPLTGHLLHRRDVGRAKKGTRAGSVKRDGYRVLSVRGGWFHAARVVWLHQYGKWPKNQIDHINHDCDDDRVENLRDVTAQQNLHNQSGRRRNNTSGTVGVLWNKRSKKWYATICVSGKSIFLGSYRSYEEAVKAREEGKRLHHFTSPGA